MIADQPFDTFLVDATAFLQALPPTPYASRLPVGYFTGWRSWDAWQIMRWADFKPTDVLLETGAWQTFAALWFAQFVCLVDATDSYYWEQRDFVKEQDLPSSGDWERTIMELGHGQVMAFPMDLMAIRRSDNSYDKITCISTIEHVLDDAKAMAEMLRVLKPGGRLLLTTEFDETRAKPYSEDDGSFYRVYNRESWEALIAPYHVLHQEISTLPHEHYFTVAFACIEKPL